MLARALRPAKPLSAMTAQGPLRCGTRRGPMLLPEAMTRSASTFYKATGSATNNVVVLSVAAAALTCVGAATYAGHKRTKLQLVVDARQTAQGQKYCRGSVAFDGSLDTQHVDIEKLPVEEAVLTAAPSVPPPITRDHPVLLKVPLETITSLKQITSMYKYEEWTFNGTTPGPFIRARVGDVVELALTNKDDTGNPHNIDSHAFTGPGGGAAVTTAEENETRTGRFRLLYPGLYLYHCAAAPVPVHIANGMFGLMYVEPEEGLPPVDKEYYVMQSEIYHEPPELDDNNRRSDIVEFSYPNGLREEPNAIVFNGSESALTLDNPLKAEVGETVRIFFGNAGPNLTSSFHIIGSHFLNCYRDGDVVSSPARNIGTVSVPSGGTSIVDLKMVVPGTYTIVDHAIFRLDKGAVGFLNVSGQAREDIYAGSPEPCVGCKLHA